MLLAVESGACLHGPRHLDELEVVVPLLPAYRVETCIAPGLIALQGEAVLLLADLAYSYVFYYFLVLNLWRLVFKLDH